MPLDVLLPSVNGEVDLTIPEDTNAINAYKTVGGHMKVRYFPGSFASVFVVSVMLTGCSGGGEPAGGKPHDLSSPAVKVDNAGTSEFAAGYALFSKTCRVCHGNEGNGSGSRKGSSLQRSEYTYGRNREAVLESIRNGRPNGMPGYGKVFSQQQLEILTSYVLTLK